MRNPSSSSSSAAAAATRAANGATSNKTTPCCVKVGLKRGPWTPEEDELLANYIKKDGEGRWRTLPKRAGLLRCGKSCRLRWMNYLRPCVKRGQIAPDEEDLILRLHRLLGNRWSLIAGRIPGRTDNEIKNYWNTHLSKKLISQGIDPRTHKPLLFNPNPNNPDNDNHPSHDIDPKASSSKAKNIPVPIIPNPNPSSSSSSGLEDIIQGNKGNNNGYYENTNLLDQEYQTGTNGISSNEEDDDDINYCTDDVFSSFLNSLINEDLFVSQHQQLQHVNNQLTNGIIAPAPPAGGSSDALISSAQAFGFSGTGWENALMSNSMPPAFNQINDPKKF